jgi:fibronectin type 3 domain-containing protein
MIRHFRVGRSQHLTRRIAFLSLESRVAPATNVLSYRAGTVGVGVNNTETELAPANLSTTTFGKSFATALDGQVYTQPLVKTGVTVVNGPNTLAGAAGVHDLVLVATQHDSVYALDANTGSVVWKRSFLDVSVPANNTLGASTITPVPAADTLSTDIAPEVGITGTPVIDGPTNTLYVVAKTKETIGGTAHFVQRLHAVSLTDGTDRVAPFLLGNTIQVGADDSNSTPIYSYGTGDGAITDPYNGTGQQVVAFDALRGNQRSALSLSQGKVYVSWASHGDTGPYHGWVVALDVSNLAGNGITLSGVFNTSPNDGLAGIWQSGGQLAFEPDGSAFYFETGNGTGGAPVLNVQGMPADGNFTEALVKVVADPSSDATHQNSNGWGLKAVDFFTPYNTVALDGADSDFGSGGPVLLPDSAGIPGHPHLIVAGGKEGKLYVLDRDHLGHFDAVDDHALNSVPNGSGHQTPSKLFDALFGTPAWFGGKLYAMSGIFSGAYAFELGSSGMLTATSQTANTNFGGLPGSPMVSANGTANGIVWMLDRLTNRLRAYDAGTLATELWNSGQAPGGADTLGASAKFAVPTVANGHVYVATLDGLVGYGHFQHAESTPLSPTLSATPLSGSAINLTWTDPTTAPNLATSYAIEQSLDGTNFTPLTTAPAGNYSLAVGGLQPFTQYFFRIRGLNAVGGSPPSNVASATTGAQAPTVDFGNGFANATGLTVNDPASISGNRLRLTSGSFQAGAAFATNAADVTSFSTRFTFQLTSATADGFTFAIQGNGPTVHGIAGGDLGYGGIANSVAVKFDLFDNSGEGYNSTGLYINGASPNNIGSIDLTPLGVNFHSEHVFRADIVYDAGQLHVDIVDTNTGTSVTQTYTVNIPSLFGGHTAFVGFTGGTGGLTAIQDILSWTYASGASFSPSVPSGLGAVPASATSVHLSWTPTSTTQAGYHLDRATDAGFTHNLITEVLPANPSAFTDVASGLAPGATYYYRLRAFNSAGDSGNSNVASVNIPLAPPTPTNMQATGVTTTGFELRWTDHAGHVAQGYRILRAENNGPFAEVDTLPPTSRTPPSVYEWSDSGLQPGTLYTYHVQAFNVSGYNDFAGITLSTLTNPPNGLAAVANAGTIQLRWNATAGAVRYNVYRGTSPGGQASTPIAAGISDTSFVDTTVTGGATYYYRVTAITANADRDPPLPAESGPSAEVTATPLSLAAPEAFMVYIGRNNATPIVAMSWDSVPGATSYNIYRSRSAGHEGDVPVASGVTQTTFLDPAGVFGATDFYQVSAVNAAGVGARSVESHATPLFNAHVNFTSTTGDAVSGFLTDSGAIFGDRGDGLKYGWTRNDTAMGFDRNAATSVDELHDSFHNMGSGTVAWHIAVPNGTYAVHVLAGDPSTASGPYRLNVGDRQTTSAAAIRGRATPENPWIENTIMVAVTTGNLWVRNAGSAINRIAAIDVNQVLAGVDLGNGFAPSKNLAKSGSARVRGTALRLTGATPFQTGNAFTTAPVSVAGFESTFDFRLSNPSADGFAFVLQGVGARAKGAGGGGLGYGGIGKSVALTFDLFNNVGEGDNATGLFLNGAAPTAAGARDLTSSAIDLHSGHMFHARVNYTDGRLTLFLTDMITGAVAVQSWVVDIVGTVGASQAYVGFTGATGSMTAVQEILNWVYTPTP